MAYRRFTMAALSISRSHRPPLHHVWGNAVGNRIFPRPILYRVEMESARANIFGRDIDLQHLCVHRSRDARAALANRAFQFCREKFDTRPCSHLARIELDLFVVSLAEFLALVDRAVPLLDGTIGGKAALI